MSFDSLYALNSIMKQQDQVLRVPITIGRASFIARKMWQILLLSFHETRLERRCRGRSCSARQCRQGTVISECRSLVSSSFPSAGPRGPLIQFGWEGTETGRLLTQFMVLYLMLLFPQPPTKLYLKKMTHHHHPPPPPRRSELKKIKTNFTLYNNW